jgi:hypothetical protein
MPPLFAEIDWKMSIIGTIILCVILNVVLYVIRRKK